MPLIIYYLSLLTLLFSVDSKSGFKYNLDKPDAEFNLPDILNEVSGLTDLDNDHVALVQDELGIVFVYNFRKGEIVSKHNFDSIGDFEGLTYTGSSLYILRSDGRMTEWKNFRKDNNSFKHFRLPVSTYNNEGLCFDHKDNRLLVAAKSKPLNHDEMQHRYIYAFDLKSNSLIEKPVYSLDVNKIAAEAKKIGIVPTDTNSKGMIKPFNYRPASLAVHPLTDEIYIISAADFMIVIIDREGKVKSVHPLNKQRFAKAEGITFLSDGTMIITNEAAGGIATLLVFDQQ